MDGQVFLIDSGYLNNFMVAIQNNSSSGKYNTGGIETPYPCDYIEESANLAAYENTEIIIESQEDSESSAIDEINNESNIFVSYANEEKVEGEHNVGGLSRFDSDGIETIEYTNNFSFNNIDAIDDRYSSAPFRFANASLPKAKILAPDASCSTPLRIKNKTVYNSSTRKRSERTNYADERYSIYSGSKNCLRNRMKSDTVTIIPPKIFKRQLLDFSDTVRPALRMPATKEGMNYLEWTVPRAFSRPVAPTCDRLTEIFTKNCYTRHEPDSQNIDDIGLMPIGFQKTIDKSKIRRITRRRKNPSSKMIVIQKILENCQKKTLPARINSLSDYIVSDGTETDCSPSDMRLSEGRLQVYVDSQQEECFLYSAECENVIDDESQQIILIHDEGVTQTADGNIRVLLAAAAQRQAPSSDYFICHDSSEKEIIVETDENCLPPPHSVFYVDDTYTEESDNA